MPEQVNPGREILQSSLRIAQQQSPQQPTAFNFSTSSYGLACWGGAGLLIPVHTMTPTPYGRIQQPLRSMPAVSDPTAAPKPRNHASGRRSRRCPNCDAPVEDPRKTLGGWPPSFAYSATTRPSASSPALLASPSMHTVPAGGRQTAQHLDYHWHHSCCADVCSANRGAGCAGRALRTQCLHTVGGGCVPMRTLHPATMPRYRPGMPVNLVR